MGLFKDVGRKVERFKQAAQDAAAEETSHRCADCGERYYTDHDACPECGGSVEPVEVDDPTGTGGPAGTDEPGEATGTDDFDDSGETDDAANPDSTDDTGGD